MNRLSGWCGWASLAVLTVLCGSVPASAAETFGYTSRKPQLWETERPVMETEPGTNLYWHDPLLGSWESCRAWGPATNGCPPAWYGRVEMLTLFRDAKEGFSFATIGPGGPVALGTGDFRSEFSAGVRALVGKTLGDWYRVEVSYFGSHSWDDSVAVRNLDPNDQGGLGNLYSPFTNFGNPAGVAGLDYNDFVSMRFSSRLNNGEVNLRRRVLMRPGDYETSFLVGGRYMQIGEQFDYLSESITPGPAVSSNFLAIDTDNQMIGVQIGLLSQFLIQQRCWIDFEMKGGIFQNRAKLNRSFTVDDGLGGVNMATGTDNIDRTSFVGDLSLQFNYQFAPSWTFYAGYNALWVTGLALGGNNFETDANMLLTGPTLIDHSGQMVYHGPNIGLVLSY